MQEMCRVCLVGGVKMRPLSAELQGLYKLLAKNQNVTEDVRSTTLCYFCFSQLERSNRFSNLARRSDNIFRYLLHSGVETTQESIAKFRKQSPYNLFVSTQHSISIGGDVFSQVNADIHTVKEEVKQEKDIEEVCIKQEVEDEMEVKNEIPDTEYDHSMTNPLEPDSNGVVNVPTTMLLTQLKKYMGQDNLADDEDTKDAVPETADILPVTTDPVPEIDNHSTSNDNLYNQCDVCQQKFHKRSDMELHMMIHYGVTPYACNICDQHFYQMAELSKHSRTAHQTYKRCKTYLTNRRTCIICHSTFSHKSLLTKHMKTHRNNIDMTSHICFTTRSDGTKVYFAI